MTPVFADTFYWVALLNRLDENQQRVLDLERAIRGRPIVTSEEVLHELLNFYGTIGRFARMRAVQFARGMFANPRVEIVAAVRDRLHAALELYEARPDKGYSLTDCVSMCLMRERGMLEVLTKDAHFRQEGFRILFDPAR
jgi:predicted nucleic acid-binding protein